MEKYSQFRDRGTAIAPFFPVPTPPASPLWTPIHVFLFAIRLAPLLACSLFYFALLQWLPVVDLVNKAVLWVILGVPGVWWVDLQVDGVRRGKLASAKDHLPGPGTIIAASFTSPLDPLYLAGIFRPVFTRSYPATRKVEEISLLTAILTAFSYPRLTPPENVKLVGLEELSKKYPQSIIAVFPECTTTNGRGILPLSPSLLSAQPQTRIYPVSLKYTPGDITTPVPGGYLSWIWKLCSKPTHSMRVRIAESVFNNPTSSGGGGVKGSVSPSAAGFDTNIFDSPSFRKGVKLEDGDDEDKSGMMGDVNGNEKRVLDRIGEDLARLGRVKRVGLGSKDKIEFLKVWMKRKR